MAESQIRSSSTGISSMQLLEVKPSEGSLSTHSISVLQGVLGEEVLKADTVGHRVIGREQALDLSSEHAIAPAQKPTSTIQKVIGAVCSFFSFIQEKLDRSSLSRLESKIQSLETKIRARGEKLSSVNVQQSIEDLDKLTAEYVQLLKKRPEFFSENTLKQLQILTKDLTEQLKGVAYSSTQKIVFGFLTIPIDILSRMDLSSEDRVEMKEDYKSCIDDGQEIADQERQSKDGTVQGGLGRDFDRTPPSHIYCSTPERPEAQEILLTSIDHFALTPLLADKSECLEVVQCLQGGSLNDHIIKCYAKIKGLDPSRLSAEQKDQLSKELQDKEKALPIVSEKLQKILQEMEPIVGGSLAFQDQMNVAKAKLDLSVSPSESSEADPVKKAKQLLEKFGFRTGSDFKFSEEVAYEILSVIPDTLDAKDKSAILQGIRSTSTLIPQKDLAPFGRVQLSKTDPHAVNVVVDRNEGVFVRHTFIMDLLSNESVENMTEEQSNRPWSEVPGCRRFTCEVLFDVKKGLCFHSIQEQGSEQVSDATLINRAKKMLRNVIKA